jgi:membrane-associated protein
LELLTSFLSFIMHLDVHLVAFVREYGLLTYAALFAVVFCETGLVVTPFLPGDSLLFATGAVAGAGDLAVVPLLALLFSAAVLGDSVNYQAGRLVGFKAFDPTRRNLLNPRHLHRTQAFFERHGGKTILLARFVPVVRTFAPFVAGIAGMRYPYFLAYNLFGGAVWVGSLTLLGYYCGNLPWAKANFGLVIYGIIAVSLLPLAVEWLRSWRAGRTG